MFRFLRLLALPVLGLLSLSGLGQAADIAVTAANVAQVSGVPQQYTAGGTITAGQCLYLNGSNQAVAAKATAAGTSSCIGIALNGASSGQPITVLTSGVINIGGTAAVGTPYVVSAANAGGIAPWTDLANPNLVSFIGYGTTTANITISIQNTGLVHP